MKQQTLTDNRCRHLPTQTERPRILFADDYEPILNTLRSAFSPSYHIKTTTDGNECIEIALSFRPTLIVLDVEMGSCNGLEICSRIKSVMQLRNIPIIFYTSYSNSRIEESATKVGALKVISKSTPIAALISEINDTVYQEM